jgi:hypothetical protein
MHMGIDGRNGYTVPDNFPESVPTPFIVGSPRSGTTLLRFLLDAHPQLAIPPETGFFLSVKLFRPDAAVSANEFYQAITSFPPDAPAWNDFHIPAAEFQRRLGELLPFDERNGIRLFYRMYAERLGKPRWGDKTPLYCRHLLDIQQHLEEAHFIHLIRDGRDVALSLREQWFSPGRDISVQAGYWRENVLTAHEQGTQCSHYLEIHFEELILQTKETLHKICEFIELDFHPDMLKYNEQAPRRLQEHLERRRTDGSLIVSQADRHRQQVAVTGSPDPSKIGAWRNALQPQEIRQFETIAGDALQRFGYAPQF